MIAVIGAVMSVLSILSVRTVAAAVAAVVRTPVAPAIVLRGGTLRAVVLRRGALGGSSRTGGLLRRGLGGRSGSRSRRLGLDGHRHLRLAAGGKVLVEAAGRMALREALEDDVELLLRQGGHMLFAVPAVLLQGVKDLLVRDVQVLGDLVDSVFKHQ